MGPKREISRVQLWILSLIRDSKARQRAGRGFDVRFNVNRRKSTWPARLERLISVFEALSCKFQTNFHSTFKTSNGIFFTVPKDEDTLTVCGFQTAARQQSSKIKVVHSEMQRKIFLTLTVILSAMIFSITVAAQGQRFSVYLNGRQEVPANNSSGNGDCRVALGAGETQVTVQCDYRNLTSNVVGAHIHENGPVGVSGPILFDFNYTGGATGSVGPLTFNVTPAQVAALRANRWYVNIHTANSTGGEIRGQIKRANVPYDRDGDGRTDILVHRASDLTVYTLNSLEGNVTTDPFGRGNGATEFFVNNIPGDYDGDGRADHVILDIDDEGVITWVILQSRTNTLRSERWGQGATDPIQTSDYDGDGKLDIAVFRRSTGIWYIIESSTGNPRYEFWGAPSDQPCVGDYDGDGKADLCTNRAENGLRIWYIRNSSNGQMQVLHWGFGNESPFYFFTIDVDGDGKQDPLVQRGVNGQRTFFVRRSSDGSMYVLGWGNAGFPLFGDYDGDGKTDFVSRQTQAGSGVYRWWIFESATQTYRGVDFGQAGDQRPGSAQDELPVGGGIASDF